MIQPGSRQGRRTVEQAEGEGFVNARVKIALAALLACSALVQAQPVYKWVDAEGKTHYGQQQPTSRAEDAPLRLQSTNGTSNGAGGPVSSPNADGTKKVPKEVAQMAEGLRKSLATVDGKQEPLQCATAVSNITGQADTMLEVGQKNLRDGYMTQAAYDTTAAQIREARGKYSVGDCQSSSGNKRGFYQCMSSSRNHVTGCASQFKH
ncbi:MAG: DUF4124 domain-containing protein [Comamonadaceae bacterium]|nr:MAG: DUF4124 domain-containing protein [Comamonadaceae bacterium]